MLEGCALVRSLRSLMRSGQQVETLGLAYVRLWKLSMVLGCSELTLRDALSPVGSFARGHDGRWTGIKSVVSTAEGTV